MLGPSQVLTFALREPILIGSASGRVLLSAYYLLEFLYRIDR